MITNCEFFDTRTDKIANFKTWGTALLLLALLTLATEAQAQFRYITGNGAVTITGYDGPEVAIIIPNMISDLPVTIIGYGAFYRHTNLTSVSIPSSVTNINPSAFLACTGLSSVVLPDHLTDIGMSAFRECSSLKSVTIPERVTTIGNYAFDFCTSLTAITVEPRNLYFTSLCGVLFNKDLTLIRQYPAGKIGNSHVIPKSVMFVGYGAFESCIFLENITVPSSVTILEFYAFAAKGNLKGVYFLGNAPNYQSIEFGPNVTVYYVPGTTGWGTTYSGRPTVLWNPSARSGDCYFDSQTKLFGFKITGTMDIPIVVEGCSNLIDATWVPLQTSLLTNGSIYFTDPQGANPSSRFYRINHP